MTEFVLIPGFGGAADFDFVAPMLAREHEVSIVDAASRLAVAPDAILVGYSLGAALAVAYAAEHAGEHSGEHAAEHTGEHPVGALVLICGWTQPTPRLLDWSTHAADEAFARHTMVGPDSDRTPLVRPELLALLDPLLDPPRDPLPVPELGKISCPTLVIGGKYDLVATAHQSRLLYGGIADSRYVELPTGHAALAERPAEVLSLLSEFAAELAVSPAAR